MKTIILNTLTKKPITGILTKPFAELYPFATLQEHQQQYEVLEDKPPYDPITQLRTEIEPVVDSEAKIYTRTWIVEDKTEEQRINEAIQLAQSLEQEIDIATLRAMLRPKVSEMSEEEMAAHPTLFKVWKPDGKWVYRHDDPNAPEDEKPSRRRDPLNGILYRCIQSHVPQVNQNPSIAHSLWVRVGEPDEVPEWSDFAAHEFQHFEIGFAVMHQGVKYYLINPGHGHWMPSGSNGHHGWSLHNPNE